MKEKILRLIEKQPFILSVAIAMIIFGFFYWKNFSSHVDDVASRITSSDKIVVFSKSIPYNTTFFDSLHIANKNFAKLFFKKNDIFQTDTLEFIDYPAKYICTIETDSIESKSNLTVVFISYKNQSYLEKLSEKIFLDIETTLKNN